LIGLKQTEVYSTDFLPQADAMKTAADAVENFSEEKAISKAVKASSIIL
jgi:hypothetical protein